MPSLEVMSPERRDWARVPRAVAAAGLLLAAGCDTATGPDRVFVSDEQANVVHVLDGLSGRSEGVLRTGARPRGLVASRDGRTLYVAASDADRIEAWDTRTLRHVRNLAPGNDPERLALSPDERTLYVANEDDSTVAAIDVASGKVVASAPTGPEPEGIGVSPGGRLLLATSEVAGVVHGFALPAMTPLDSVPVGTRARDILFLSDSRAWISSEARGTVTVLDLPTMRIVATIELAAALPEFETVQAVEMERTADGARVFVALGRGDAVAELDPRSGRVRRTFPTGHRTWGIALSPEGERLYAASGLSGTLTVIDLVRNRVLRTVRLGGKPWTAVSVAR